MAHSDAKEDKKIFSGMLKKALKGNKDRVVEHHLKHDIKEAKKGIKEDKSLMKTVKKKGKY